MNVFPYCVMLFCQKVPFPATTAVGDMMYLLQWCEFSNLGDLGSWKAAGVLLSVSVPLLSEHYADLCCVPAYYYHIITSHTHGFRLNATPVSLCCVVYTDQWQLLLYQWLNLCYIHILLFSCGHIIPVLQQSEKLIRIKN